ncbi:MAG: FAD-dependent oxidoreductase [Tannerellaceae bacterium]|jgi:all-trans-retinol 13,14-reductase|nr:FAD-dependent oxidoreductase [Tannerellaceae bacterium]
MNESKRVIIIGSGLGGLCCGYLLSKHGYQVSIYEKNRQIGGCLQTFIRNNIKFETGMHYIGSMNEGEIMHDLFEHFGLIGNVHLRQLDTKAYDIVSMHGMHYPFANGEEECINGLTRFFPVELPSLKKYWKGVNDIINSSAIYSWQTERQFTPPNYELLTHSASLFLRETIANVRLRHVLAGNSILCAAMKFKTPLYFHAIIRKLYNSSAYRIVGGSDQIALSLARSIEQAGGEIITNSPVCKINCDSRNAIGITLQSGDERRADYFISNVHPARLMELLDTPLIRPLYRERIKGLENTIANFTVYIQFRKDSMPYFNSNFFHLSGDTAWDTTKYSPKNWPKSFLYMHLCSSINQRYADGAILIAYMNFSEVAKWKGTRSGQRGDEYEDFKQQKAAQLLDALEKQMPGTRIRIETYYTSSPLTYLDYTGTEAGSTYGIVRDSARPLETNLTHRTKIPNLFQSGQNTYSHGMLGVMMGAIVTAADLL